MTEGPTPRRVRLGVALLGLAFWVTLVAPSPATAAGNGSWDLQAPADLSTDGTSLDLELAPGSSRETFVDVINLTRSPLSLNLSVTAGRVDTPPQRWDADGTSIASPDTASWVQLGSPSVQLAPESSQRVPFLVTIPFSATPGDYLAAVFSTGTVTVDPLTGERSTQGWQSLLRIRVAGPVLTSLTATGLDVNGAEAVLGLRNTGGTRINPTISVQATNASSQPVDAVAPAIAPLESGELVSVRIPLAEVPTKVLVTVTSEAGSEALEWPVPTLEGSVLPPGEAAPSAGEAGLDGATIAVLAAASLLLLVALLTARRDRRRKRQRQRAAQRRKATTTSQPEESASIAELLDTGPPPAQASSIVSQNGPSTIIAPR